MRGAGHLQTLAAVLTSVVVTGCTSGIISAEVSGSATTSPAAPTTVPAPSSVQEIPGQPPVVHYGTVEKPMLGVAYEYHLYVHCGIRTAEFGGRLWLAVSPTDSLPAETAGTRPPNPNYLTGSMTLLTPDRARFSWDGGTADFAPATSVPPPCA